MFFQIARDILRCFNLFLVIDSLFLITSFVCFCDEIQQEIFEIGMKTVMWPLHLHPPTVLSKICLKLACWPITMYVFITLASL